MKRGLIHAGAMAMALAAPPFAMAAPAQAAVQNDGAGREARAAAVQAVTHANMLRVSEDVTYAEEMLGHLDLVEPLATTAGARLELDDIRMVALASLRRAEELGPVFDRIMDQRPRDPHQYGRAWWAALVVTDIERIAAVVEHASRNIPASGWGELRGLFDREDILWLLREFRSRGDDDRRARLAAALFRIGWPGPSEHGITDLLRIILIDDRLRQGDDADATDYMSGLTSPRDVALLIVQRRYDALFPAGVDRLARFEAALAENDRNASADLAAAPGDLDRVLDRAQSLRRLGRNDEAIALLDPFTRDIPATVSAHTRGFWLVNEAVSALLSVGRSDEAAVMMGRLAAMPIAENPDLINSSINYGSVLRGIGRHEEALANSRQLEREYGQFASEFGRMWIRANIVCSLAVLNRRDEVRPVLETMRELADENQAALIRSYLCLNDLDSAEALMIRWLESDYSDEALLAVQDYVLVNATALPDPVYDRFIVLRDRPAVRAAIERIGRVLQLPVARTYWGGV